MKLRDISVEVCSSRIEGHVSSDLIEGWRLTRTAPGAFASPDQFPTSAMQWVPGVVPGTVAMSLGADLNTIGRYDADDWWYDCHFAATTKSSQERRRLRFEGLATLAEVWLNGQLILNACNMFVAHVVDVTDMLQSDNELIICLRSLDQVLAARKPRPRWKTALVEHQTLRWVRTTLLGRIPGWTPPIQPVGPWKPVRLETVVAIDLRSLDLQTMVLDGICCLRVNCEVGLLGRHNLTEARLRLSDETFALGLSAGSPFSIHGDLRIAGVDLWWPHTHGKPALYDCCLELQVDGQWLNVDCGRIGFKALRVERGAGQVLLQVNDIPVFCRGACWTTDDFLALHGDVERLRATLHLARDSGLNMLRVGGTMTYESSAFYALCDELGIMVWQDFMFANMDYPVDDAGFRDEIETEVEQQLRRLQRHTCVSVYCGGSEVEQQAAMLGLPANQWSNDFFNARLPSLCDQWHSGVPYFRSSPSEGALPFHVGTGISHYYGVGAYRRPLSEVKHAGVKFAAECLGFSHVPDSETMELLMGGGLPPPHHPLWKARQPRDSGAGWDFEDIRDHYLHQLFGVDPIALRSQDVSRYYTLSRVVTGEVLQRVYSEWRAPNNVCGGGLVWFFKDLWPGAGWGIVDSTGRPKAAYWYLKRAWASRTVRITDAGLDGLMMHVFNERPELLTGTLQLAVYQHGSVCTARAEQAIKVDARGALTVQGDALLGSFFDTAYAYRFGPPQHDVIVATLLSDCGEIVAEDFYFSQGMDMPMLNAVEIMGQARRMSDGAVVVDISSKSFLQSVQFECDGYASSDAYFHLAPNVLRQVVFRPQASPPARFKAHITALNIRELLTVRAD